MFFWVFLLIEKKAENEYKKTKIPIRSAPGNLLAPGHAHFHPLLFNLFVQEMCAEWVPCASQLWGTGAGEEGGPRPRGAKGG